LFCGIVIVLSTVAFLIWDIARDNQNRCDYIESLAGSPRVVGVLDQWASENVINKNYYFVSGIDGSIAARRSDDDEIHYLPLPDSKVTGINNEYFRFSLSKHESKYTDNIVSNNVHSLYFGRARDSIILTKNGHELSSHRGHDFESDKFKKIRESVYAYCSNGKFRM
jgi:hypothetical protein